MRGVFYRTGMGAAAPEPIGSGDGPCNVDRVGTGTGPDACDSAVAGTSPCGWGACMGSGPACFGISTVRPDDSGVGGIPGRSA